MYKTIKSLRMLEALLVSGFIFIGGLFGIYKVGTYDPMVLAVVAFISYSLMLSIYSFNAYLGFNEDKVNPRLKQLTLFPRNFYLFTTIAFYTLSLLATLFLKTNNVFLHIIIFVLWFFYSVPGFGKHLPVIGTLIHFIVQIVQFNFAYSFFSPITFDSLLISCFFALLFCAGHLHHEIIDYEVDANNAIKSSTVLWGVKKVKYFSFGLFVLAYILLFFLFSDKFINVMVYAIFGITAFFQLILFLYYNKQFENNSQARLTYRLFYRILFLISGIVFTCFVLF